MRRVGLWINVAGDPGGGSQCTLLFEERKQSDLDTDSELHLSTLFS